MNVRKESDRRNGFTLLEMWVVIAFLTLLFVGFVLPAISSRPRMRYPASNCISNLRQIGTAYRLWDDDHSGKYPMQVSTNEGGSLEYAATGDVFRHFRCMSNELSTPKLLGCADDDRTRATNFASLQNSNISYFVGVDALEQQNAMLLGGDRNLSTNGVPLRAGLASIAGADKLEWSARMHKDFGIILFADGSVQKVSSSQLPGLLQKTGTNVNRVAIP